MYLSLSLTLSHFSTWKSDKCTKSPGVEKALGPLRAVIILWIQCIGLLSVSGLMAKGHISIAQSATDKQLYKKVGRKAVFSTTRYEMSLCDFYPQKCRSAHATRIIICYYYHFLSIDFSFTLLSKHKSFSPLSRSVVCFLGFCVVLWPTTVKLPFSLFFFIILFCFLFHLLFFMWFSRRVEVRWLNSCSTVHNSFRKLIWINTI